MGVPIVLSGELERDILIWINGAESNIPDTQAALPRASVRLLLLSLALRNKERMGTDITQSTQVSFLELDRTNLFRTLIKLSKQGHLEFIGNQGEYINEQELNTVYSNLLNGSFNGEVQLTASGLLELIRQKKLMRTTL